MAVYGINPTLHSHPSRHYPQWYSSVSAFAASIGTSDFQYGMVHLVITADAWTALPGNTNITADGGIVITPTPNPQQPGHLAGSAGAGTVHIYREDTELYRRYLGYVATLRTAIMESLGHAIQLSLRDPTHNIIVMTIPQIMATIAQMYGTASASDIEALLAQLSIPIDGGDHDTFVAFSVNFQQINAALTRAGQPLSNYLQCRRLQEATAGQSLIARAIALYFENTPLLANQSLLTLIPFVRQQLQNTTSVASFGYANTAAVPTIPVQLRPQLPSTFDSVTAAYLAGLEAGRGQQRRNQRAAQRGGPSSNSIPQQQYCYHHGYGNHSGQNCNFMRC